MNHGRNNYHAKYQDLNNVINKMKEEVDAENHERGIKWN